MACSARQFGRVDRGVEEERPNRFEFLLQMALEPVAGTRLA
jgi:hypothetical protein